MKKILFISVLICCIMSAYSQENSYDTTEIVQVQNISKDDLFNRALEWVSASFNMTNDVIDVADKNDGRIIVKGNTAYVAPPASGVYSSAWVGFLQFTLKIYIKDGRFKYEVLNTGFISSQNPNNPPIPITKSKELPFYLKGKKGEILWKDLQDNSLEQITSIGNRLKEAMLKETSLEKNDW